MDVNVHVLNGYKCKRVKMGINVHVLNGYKCTRVKWV